MMVERWHSFRAMVFSHWLQMSREPEVLFWAFVFPVLLTLGLGIAFRQAPASLPAVGVIDSEAGKELYQKLSASEDLKLSLFSREEGKKRLRHGQIALLVDAGDPVVIRLDPTRPDSTLARLQFRDTLERALGRQDRATVQEEKVTEPGSRYIDFLIPGLLGMNIMNSGFWGMGFNLVEMRIKKLLKRLAATPMRRGDFLASFVVARMALILMEMVILLGAGTLLFGLQVQGSWFLALGLCVLGCLCFSSLGIWVGSRVAKIETAIALINFASMPMLLLSGVFFTYERFPEAVWPLLRLFPLTALNDGLRAVVNEGAGPSQLWAPALVLGVWTLVGFGLGTKRFRWT